MVALLTAVWTVWFMVAFVPWISTLPPWQGIDAYAASFAVGPYLAWAVPCLLLALTYPLLALVLHHMVDRSRRLWSEVGLLFAALYGGILGSVYWILVAVVPARIQAGDLSGLAPLVVVSPHSVANSLEWFGYLLMGLSLVFLGLAVPGERPTRWIRRALVIDGLGGVGGFLFLLTNSSVAGMISLVVWSVALPVACVLLARHLWKLAPTLRAIEGSERGPRLAPGAAPP